MRRDLPSRCLERNARGNLECGKCGSRGCGSLHLLHLLPRRLVFLRLLDVGDGKTRIAQGLLKALHAFPLCLRHLERLPRELLASFETLLELFGRLARASLALDEPPELVDDPLRLRLVACGLRARRLARPCEHLRRGARRELLRRERPGRRRGDTEGGALAGTERKYAKLRPRVRRLPRLEHHLRRHLLSLHVHALAVREAEMDPCRESLLHLSSCCCGCCCCC
mmetsp:Transcript_21155/g.68451  ORF Transcript_21155/g.68451 Transcript_21155/m.68451 type:complete len:225 (+) Transcript_21155:1207-1881(+)